MILGEIRVKEFLERSRGEVIGRQVSDAKDRYYEATYEWKEVSPNLLEVQRKGSRSSATIPAVIPLDEALVAFLGLYSGDGAKGSEDLQNPGRLKPSISFCQREPNLIRFAVHQFRTVFPEARFTFSFGEDAAYFMSGEGMEELIAHYGGSLPTADPLTNSALSAADKRYLQEKRRTQEDVEADLAFYYHHKAAMEKILRSKKELYIRNSGIELSLQDRVTASLRRPYKKGARLAGGSSRSDETHVGNVTGMGELFLKMLHETESSIQEDQRISTHGLVVWKDRPSTLGQEVSTEDFFARNKYGVLAGERPSVTKLKDDLVVGLWRRSQEVTLNASIKIDPLWCYTAGLYLAEGTTDKRKMFGMYHSSQRGMGLGFTSSENTSLELMLRALQKLFPPENCVTAWKVKVGSQYFPELVVVGLKNAVPMLRGGKSGDGKLRTMEISLAIKNWALEVVPAIAQYEDKYSHVEPTGAGVPRVDFWGSSSLCKWYFPLVIYATFGSIVEDPLVGFIYD